MADQPLALAFGATLVDANTALILDSDGTLRRLDMMSGISRALPYRIDPGDQGGDIALVR